MPMSFDNELINKIRETFDQYHEPFNEHAWELMKDNLKAKKKRSFILFINIAKAASIVLIIGISVLIPYTIRDQKTNNIIIEKVEDTSLNNNFTAEYDEISNSNTIENLQNNYEINNQSNFRENILVIVEKENKVLISIDSVSNKDIEKKMIIAENNSNVNLGTTTQINEKDSLKNNDNRPILDPNTDDFFKEKKNKKKFNFGIALSSHYTSSEIGANEIINVGGGFLTEYMLCKRFSVSSGIFVSNHNLSTENTNLSFGFKKADAATNESFYDPSGETSKQVELVGLDIPLNININFDKFFVSAGVSSLVYLKEEFKDSYYVENTQEVFNSEINDYETLYLYDNVSDDESIGAFRTFDFAKLMNLSVGYKIPLKKGKLIIEPYIKYPIGNLTSRNFSFGYGGMSLRYKF